MEESFKHHQDVSSVLSGLYLSNVQNPPWFPTPIPSTKPQQIVKRGHSDCRSALVVRRENKVRNLCALNTQNAMHLLNQGARNQSLRFLAEIKGWARTPIYKTFCQGQILLLPQFVICLFQWSLLTNSNITSVWSPDSPQVMNAPSEW